MKAAADQEEFIYIAHTRTDPKDEQPLQAHLEGTALLAKQFADAFGYGEWGYCCGKLHDIGKYSDKFQRRIRNSGEKTDHATAGAQLCRSLGGYYQWLAYCIAGHHAGLPDTGGSADTANRPTMEGRMKKTVEDYSAYKQEIEVPKLSPAFFLKAAKTDPSFTIGFFIRMLYSCLVDADFLDTERFMGGGDGRRRQGEDMKALFGKLQKHISQWLHCEEPETINGRRTEILRHCMKMGQGDRGLYRLTVPTGGGKTIASLAFALQHAVELGMDHIIYVIPYTSIIEQNAKVFSEILGDDNVLEHHCNVNHEGGEELKTMELAAENWDKPVIVTTNVQFFESLFSNRSSKCRKLHNVANSVIVFDEAQMLPNDYLKPCLAAVEELVRYYRSSVVLCTATQPALEHLFSRQLVYRELCPNVEEQFAFFKRVNIVDMGTVSRDYLLSHLRQEQKALCICNTKRKVREIYDAIAGDGVYHLSTFMYPAHRKRMLEQIRRRLKQDMKCIVVSTSLIEAGVDLDFHTVYRELAGVDSIIQAAGRCNREGKRKLEESSAYVFRLEEAERIPGQEQQIDTSKQVFRYYKDVSDLKAIQEYFRMLYEYKGEGLDKKHILDQFQKGHYSFGKVGKEFRLIEENTNTVLIPTEKRAEEIVEELRLKGATRALMREAGQYCVSVYETMFNHMLGMGMLLPISEDLRDTMFLLKNKDDYTEAFGLKTEVGLGMDLWF